MVQPRWDVPAPTYERDVNEIVRIYKNAINEVIITLEGLSTYGKDNEISRAQMNSIIAQLGVLLSEVDNERSEEHTSELQSRFDLVCRLLLEKKNQTTYKCE